MKSTSRDWQLVVLLAGYLIASLTYGILIPWRWAPDEIAHYEFVQHLAREGRLPVFNSSEENFEAHQPPLYYTLAVPFFWLSQLVGTPKVIRLLALLSGAGVVACTYWVGKRLYSRDKNTALLAGAIAAFLPTTLTMNSSVSNDSLTALIFSLFALWVIGLSGRRIGARTGLGVGALVGVGILTKLPCGMLGVLAVVAILLFAQESREEAKAASFQGRGQKKPAGKWVAGIKPRTGEPVSDGHLPLQAVVVAGGTALVICGWWLVRNQVLYGDPFAWGKFVEVFRPTRYTPEFFLSRGFSIETYIELVGLYTFKTFWGSFGQTEIFLPGWMYLVWFGVCVGIVLGWIRLGFEGQRKEAKKPGMRPDRRQVWLLVLQIALLFALFLRFNTVFFQGHARYLLVAVTPIAIFMAWGMLGMFPPRWRRGAALLFSAGFFAHSMVALFVWGLPGYAGSLYKG